MKIVRTNATHVVEYEVKVDGKVVAVAQQRRGGYWRAWSTVDDRHSGSFCRSRKEALAACVSL